VTSLSASAFATPVSQRDLKVASFSKKKLALFGLTIT
jgi:hypothetical protein